MLALQDINDLPRQKMSHRDFKGRGDRLGHRHLLRGYLVEGSACRL